MRKISLLVYLLLACYLTAQNKLTNFHSLRCGTDLIHREMLNSNPDYKNAQDYFENVVIPIAKNNANQRQQGVVYQVPVVVHVMHKGEAIGFGTNISDEQVKLGIKYLNNFWRKIQGTNGDGGGVDMGIEFLLAVRDTNGNCTNGIVRKDMSSNATYVNNGVKLSSAGITDATLKAASFWDRNKYYNVYLVDEIDNENCSSTNGFTAGYAYFASSHGTSIDGAVMLTCAYLDPNDITFAHEMGHAFNLYHTFEGDRDTNSDGKYDACPGLIAGCGSSKGDCCDDIPAHIRTMDIPNLYYDCSNADANTCVPGTTHQDHMLNYMDYTGCANEFTSNQQTIAVAALTSTRKSFLQSNGNLSLVPVSKAGVDFSVKTSLICVGNSVGFTDNSSCFPNSYTNNQNSGITYSWSFTNNAGTTLTSSLQNPVMTFNAAGNYDVSLTINHSTLGSSVTTKQSMITVVNSPASACTPTSIYEGNYWQTVYNVKLNTLSKETDKYDNLAYSDFSCTNNTVLNVGQTYTIDIAGHAGNGKQEVFEVYLDYNNNGTFESTEKIHSGTIAVGKMDTISGSFTVPATATVNKLLRMRVIGEYDAISTNERNCNASSDKYEIGDVEDYGIYIISNCTPPTQSGTLSACVGLTSQLTGSGTAATSGAWTSSATGVATVSTSGLVTAVGAGTTTITYKNNSGCTTSSTFTVNANPTISGTLSACVGLTSQLTGSGTAATSGAWTSSATGVATVSTSGLVTAVGAGTTTITYKNNSGCTTSSTFTVNANPTISGTLSACVGLTSQLTGSGTAATSGAWTSSASGVATVSSSGLVTAVGAGATTITYKNNSGCTKASTFTVNANPTISGTLSACVGLTSQLIGSGTAATSGAWTSSATGVATVSTSGLVTAVGAGTTTITYKNNSGCTISSTFTVNANPTISGTLSACVGLTSQLTGSGTAATSGAWTSSATGVATVSTSGLVTAVGAGSTTITYKNNSGCIKTSTFTVNANPTLSGTLSACVGLTSQLIGSGTAATSGAWTSSATGVATVSTSGLVTAVGAGTTTITYKNNSGCIKTSTFTVNAKPIIQVSKDTSICSGGIIALKAASNNIASFLWSGPASYSSTNQNPTIVNSTTSNSGIYTVVVTNQQNCSDSKSINAIVKALPKITNSESNVYSCVSYSVSFVPTADLQGTTFNWVSAGFGKTLGGYSTSGNGPINELLTSSGDSIENVIYNIIPSANGCVGQSFTYFVTLLPVPNPDFAMPDSICSNNDPVKLIPVQSGGQFIGLPVIGDMLYPTNANNTSVPVTYSVTVNGCTSSYTKYIKMISAPSAQFLLNNVCEGNTVQIQLSGQQGGVFSILPNSNGETVSNTGLILGTRPGILYTVTYTTPTSFCQNTYSGNLIIYPVPDKPLLTLVNDTLVCNSAQVNYNWIYNGSPIGVHTNYYVPSSNSGNYQVEVIDTNQCTSLSDGFNYQFTGISSVKNNDSVLTLFPNPTNELVTILIHKKDDYTGLDIKDVFGRLVYTLDLGSMNLNQANTFTLNLNQLGKAIYFYSLTKAHQIIQTGKLIIQ